MIKNLTKIRRRITGFRSGGKLLLTAVVAGIALLGIVFLYSTGAAGPFIAGEPENGTLRAPAQVLTDTTASGGKAVKFSNASVVNATTLDKKFMMGYQGWFLCPGDGSPPNRWVHWFRGNTTTDPSTDMWPDMTEVPAGERCNTGFTKPDGSPRLSLLRLQCGYRQPAFPVDEAAQP